MAISTSDSSLVASTSSLPVASPPAKLEGNDWWESIGKPKYVVAPMVDQSELVSRASLFFVQLWGGAVANATRRDETILPLGGIAPAVDRLGLRLGAWVRELTPSPQAWRILSRLHGATLAYTPMFHALLFSSTEQPRYAQEQFDTSALSLEGKAPYDRPLVVQFCANDKDAWLRAASKVVGHCDAVDLNLGCPQGIAKKGKYGAFLMDEWELIGDMSAFSLLLAFSQAHPRRSQSPISTSSFPSPSSPKPASSPPSIALSPTPLISEPPALNSSPFTAGRAKRRDTKRDSPRGRRLQPLSPHSRASLSLRTAEFRVRRRWIDRKSVV